MRVHSLSGVAPSECGLNPWHFCQASFPSKVRAAFQTPLGIDQNLLDIFCLSDRSHDREAEIRTFLVQTLVVWLCTPGPIRAQSRLITRISRSGTVADSTAGGGAFLDPAPKFDQRLD